MKIWILGDHLVSAREISQPVNSNTDVVNAILCMIQTHSRGACEACAQDSACSSSMTCQLHQNNATLLAADVTHSFFFTIPCQVRIYRHDTMLYRWLFRRIENTLCFSIFNFVWAPALNPERSNAVAAVQKHLPRRASGILLEKRKLRKTRCVKAQRNYTMNTINVAKTSGDAFFFPGALWTTFRRDVVSPLFSLYEPCRCREL